MDKLIELDKLIAEVLGINEKATADTSISPDAKGTADIKTGKGPSGGLGLNMAEILKILQVGSEGAKTIKSSSAALGSLITALPVKMDYNSSQGIVNFFAQFDKLGEKTMRDPCSSLSGLMSRYMIAAGLVSVFEQFNGSAGGYVGENLIAHLFKGATIAVSSGGIEDIVVNNNIGINLKIKKSTAVHGSFTQLLETLGIPYIATWYPDAELKNGGYYKVPKLGGSGEFQKYQGIRHTPAAIVNGKPTGGMSKGQNITVTSDPAKTMQKLYYLFFEKTGDDKKGTSRGLVVYCAELDKSKISNKQLSLEDMNNPIYGSIDQLIALGTRDGKAEPGSASEVLSWAKYEFTSNFDVESMNVALENSAKGVMESMQRLDAWYGSLQQEIIKYVSSLDHQSFKDLNEKLDEAEQWQFKAFNENCDK